MIRVPTQNKETAHTEIFYDAEESEFYGRCVEALLTREDLYGDAFKKGILEFGSGNGLAIARALKRARFTGSVRGIERQIAAYKAALESVQAEDVGALYAVDHGDFFLTRAAGDERCAIGNPPYLPAKFDKIRIPGLWGGEDGGTCIRRLLSMNFDVVMIVIASISNPTSVLAHGHQQGYIVSNWVATPLTFGVYSREPVVWARIQELRASAKAFSLGDEYLIAGVTWVQRSLSDAVDRSDSLERVLTSLAD